MKHGKTRCEQVRGTRQAYIKNAKTLQKASNNYRMYRKIVYEPIFFQLSPIFQSINILSYHYLIWKLCGVSGAANIFFPEQIAQSFQRNPFSPKSDQHQISPHHISAL